MARALPYLEQIKSSSENCPYGSSLSIINNRLYAWDGKNMIRIGYYNEYVMYPHYMPFVGGMEIPRGADGAIFHIYMSDKRLKQLLRNYCFKESNPPFFVSWFMQDKLRYTIKFAHRHLTKKKGIGHLSSLKHYYFPVVVSGKMAMSIIDQNWQEMHYHEKKEWCILHNKPTGLISCLEYEVYYSKKYKEKKLIMLRQELEAMVLALS